MDDNLNGTQKIVALRDAVMALYDELRADPDPARGERPPAALRRRALFEHGQCRRADPRGEPRLICRQRRISDRACARLRHADRLYRRPGSRREPPVIADLWQLDLAVRLRQIWPQRQLLGLQPERDDRRRPGPGGDLDAHLLEQRGDGRRLGLVGRVRHVGHAPAAAGAATSRPTPPIDDRYRYDRAAGPTSRNRSTSATTRWARRSRSPPERRDQRRQRRRSTAITTRSSMRARARPAASDHLQRHLERLHRGARDGQHDHRRRRATRIPTQRLRPQHQPRPARRRDTRWRPMFPQIVYRRTAGSTTAAQRHVAGQRGLPGARRGG